MGVSIRVPATTANMGPGFDTFGMALSLYNLIEADWGNGKLVIEATGIGSELIPVTEENTVYQAMQKVFVKAEQQHMLERQLRIRIQNQVPVTRGLGSSATAIVGGLWAANELLNQPFSESELLQMAVEMEGHPDNVAPAIYGGIVVAGILNNGVYAKRFSLPRGMECVVAVPVFQLATRTSRRALPPAVPHKDAVFNVNRASLMVAALCDADLHMFCECMEDYLHEPYRMPLVPGMKEAILQAKQAGAMSAVLSGSGPSLIAFCTERAEEIGEAMRRGFLMNDIPVDIFHLSPSEQGVSIFSPIS